MNLTARAWCALLTSTVASTLRALPRALLPLALFAFWLAPGARPTAAAPVAAAAHVDGPAVAIESLRAAAPSAPLFAEVEDPDPRPPLAARRALRPTDRPPPRALTLDPTTLARSRGPIYRVRRSGQAHRSAP